MPDLEALGEIRLIEAIGALGRSHPVAADRRVTVGIGDDAALLSTSGSTLVTTDSMVEGVHFRRDWLSWAQLGGRAFRAAVSDVAACGGSPKFAVLSLSLPRTLRGADAVALVRGFVGDAKKVGTSLVGGNVARDEHISITTTILADAPPRVPLRTDAKVGDDVYVTGFPGEACAGVRSLEEGKRSGRVIRAYRTPPLRVRLGRRLARRSSVHAMIDVSDGLYCDLGRVCEASEVSMRIDTDRLPVSKALGRAVERPRDWVLRGGEDYELAFTAARAARASLGRLEGDDTVTRIGEVVEADREADLLDNAGQALDLGLKPFEHFEVRR